MARIQGRRAPRLEARDRVWIARMRELTVRAEHAEQRALARRRDEDVEDVEFDDRPVRALGRSERDLAEPAVREIIRERESSWMPLAIGLGIVALIGVAGVVVYLLVRRKDNGATAVLGAVDPRYLPYPVQQQFPAPAPQVFVINTGSAQPPAAIAPPSAIQLVDPATTRPPFYPSTTPTQYRLPASSSNTVTQLATTASQPIEVTVSIVEPVGSMALLAFSPNIENATEAIVVRSGREQRIRIPAHQTLYGKGSNSAVTLSVASTT